MQSWAILLKVLSRLLQILLYIQKTTKSVLWVGVYEIILRVLDAVLGYTVKSVMQASNLALRKKKKKE